MDLIVHRKQSWMNPVSTCGLMEIDLAFFCYTLERQKFQDGMAKPYSIPVGKYGILLLPSYRFENMVPRPSWYAGQVPHITDVPDFTGTEIHPANWPSQLLGCVGVGSIHYSDYPDPLNNQVRGGCVLGSDAAFAKLMAKLKSATDPISISFVEEP